MNKTANKRVGHLRVLICYTIMETALIMEAQLLGWDMAAVLLLLFGLAVSWWLHITASLEPDLCLWLYFILTMLAFFYYGTHETSIYDLAPTIIAFILLMSGTENSILPRLCTITYFFTMIYSLIFVAGDTIELNALNVTRTMLHFGLVCIADWLVKSQQRERMRLIKEMEGKMAELEENNHKMENFLVNVSHELRTPINVIMGFASVILDKERDPLKRQDVLPIQRAGRKLFDRIEDILDYTEIDMGSIQINREDYMISSVVNDIVTDEWMREEENAVEIIFDVDPMLPARLSGDGRKIKKILKHLIDNAVKFTPQGAVLVQITGLPREYGINLHIKVTDTGIGIKKESLKKISGKFYQQDGERSRKAGGLGLGLSIVYGIVSAMEGFLKITSKEGEGTVVSVSIPQGVIDESNSISVENPEQFCVACYLKPEKYVSTRVFEFYDGMISHMAKGLNISLRRAGNESELERFIAKYPVTHLFIGKEEYVDRPSYYEKLCGKICVAVVTDDIAAFPQNSRVEPLKKPFYFLPILDILNKEGGVENEPFCTGRMMCPDIRTLIVDDEPMNLMVAEEIFKSYGMKVRTAGSGKEAIKICAKEEFDLIFLDHMMPEMDGVETLKRLRGNGEGKHNREIVIAFTANAVSGARDMFLAEGFDEFISKPIEKTELERVLKRVLPRNAIIYSSGHEDMPKELPPEPAAGFAALDRAGIHTQTALAYCMDDEEFYKKILTSFVEDSVQKKEEMRRYRQNADWEDYRVLVHALKSTARMIGADELSGMAKAVEEAAKKSDGDYIAEHDSELMEEYDRIVQTISDALG